MPITIGKARYMPHCDLIDNNYYIYLILIDKIMIVIFGNGDGRMVGGWVAIAHHMRDIVNIVLKK